MSQFPTVQFGGVAPPVLPPNPAPGWLLQLWLRRLLEDWLRRRQPPPPDNKPVPPPPDPPLAAEEVRAWIWMFDGMNALQMDALRRSGASNPETASIYMQLATCCNEYGIPYQTSPGAPTP
jgi:hypothetical protein